MSTWDRLSFEVCGIYSLIWELEHEHWDAERAQWNGRRLDISVGISAPWSAPLTAVVRNHRMRNERQTLFTSLALWSSIPAGLIFAAVTRRFSIIEGLAGEVGYEDDETDEHNKSG